MENAIDYIKDIKRTSTIEEYIEEISKWNSIHAKQKEFIEELTSLVYQDYDNTISVCSVRCGMGKSTAIEAILRILPNGTFGEAQSIPDEAIGAILITDSIKRLEETFNYRNLKKFAYLMKYDNAVLENENRKTFIEQIKEQFKYPIILLTTQRYFKMTPEERNILYKWRGGSRSMCFIDEKPYLTQTIEVNERYLADISVALDEIKKCDDKVYLIKTWKVIYDELYSIRERMSDKYTTMWLKTSKNSLLMNEDEDKEFFNKLSKYVTSQIYENVIRLKDIYTNGCLFISSDQFDTDNSRKFILTYNNIDKFDTDKCKYIVLDATANFDIDYAINRELIKFMEIDDKKEIKDITVNFIPFSTSQKKLKTIGDYSNLDVICKWINNNFTDVLVECNRGANGVIYNRFKNKLKTKNIEYFGNIKGINDYSSLREVVHIGFNRYSDVVYLQSYIIHKNMAAKWNAMNNEDIKNEIDKLLETEKGIFKNSYMRDIFISKCVVDAVQNIMRIKCRHFTNEDPCNIWIIAGESYESIITRIVDNVGARYNKFLPNEFEEAKVMSRKAAEGKEMTNPQKVMKYLNGLEKGTTIKTKDIYDNTGLTTKELNKAKKNDLISKWFNEHTIKKGQYVV